MKRLSLPMIICAATLSVLASLGCGGAGGEASPVDATREFMTEVINGDYESAYGMLSEASQDMVSYEEFTEGMNEGTPESLEGVEFRLTQETSASAEVAITWPGGDTGSLPLVREDGAWRLDLTDSYGEAKESAEEKTCLANMRIVISGANIFAADTGAYPSSLQQLVEKYIDGTASDYDCPSGGTITWNFSPAGPPEPVCSVHGEP